MADDRDERERERPLYMIGVAAELAGMHPQTLRIYERRQLVRPTRSRGNTRLYSDADIERLRVIQRLTQDEGVNLAGVSLILEMREEMARMTAELERLEALARGVERRIAEERERVQRDYRADIVLVRRGGIAPRDRG